MGKCDQERDMEEKANSSMFTHRRLDQTVDKGKRRPHKGIRSVKYNNKINWLKRVRSASLTYLFLAI